ncbi:MAG: MFS transporter [Myxococcales bacterium]|nr:MFS transporter [Myxococcales bacterium]
MTPPLEASRARILALGMLALLTLVPVTLPVPVLRELVLERFAVSELATSTFMSINMVGAILAAPIAGAISDRFGRRRALVVSALLIDAACFLALTLSLPFGAFMTIRFVEGCAHIFALSLVLAHATALAPEGQRGRVMGVVGAGLLLGVALGAPMGGIIGRSGPLTVLYAGVGVLVAAAVFAFFAMGGPQGTAAHDKPGLREITAMMRARPLVIVPLVFAFIDRFTVGFFTTTFSLYLKRIHEVPSAKVGLLIAAFMLPFALLSYPFGRLSERVSAVKLLGGGSLGYGIATATLGWWPIDGLLVLMLSLGIMAAVMFVPSMLLTVEAADQRARATALGAFNAAGSLGFIVGPLVGGAVSQWVAATDGWAAGYRAAFQVAGLSEVLCVLLTLPFLGRLAAARRRAPP